MRRARSVLLLAILAVAGAVTASYWIQRERLRNTAPALPVPLPLDVSAVAVDWTYTHTVAGQTKLDVRAKSFRQIKDPSVLELRQVELRVYDESKRRYDLVRSALATYDAASGRLYSEGEVEITLGLNEHGERTPGTVVIHTSGVTFERDTVAAFTDRAATFEFQNGTGSCVGAGYESQAHRLQLRSQVSIAWRGTAEAQGGPMMLEAGDALYLEEESMVALGPWAKLTKGTSVIESGPAKVFLNEEGSIGRVEAVQARGSDRRGARLLNYEARELTVLFASGGQVSKVGGTGGTKLVSRDPGGELQVSGQRLDLEFESPGGETLLRRAVSHGDVRLVSKPAPEKQPPQDTRVLTSETVEVVMRAGAEGIALLRTHEPGRLQLLPALASRPLRTLDGERITLEFAEDNRLQRLFATSVRTLTEPPQSSSPPAPPVVTTSRALNAVLDPKTGDLSRIEQWDDFRYQRGDRQASSVSAVMDNAGDRITLSTQARVWDPSGSTSADRIELRQSTGDAVAEGRVVSVRLPEGQSRPGEGILNPGSMLHARADRMLVTDRNTRIRYEGGADLWSGADRLRAPLVEIDRERRTLRAEGGVFSRLADRSSAGQSSGRAEAPARNTPAGTAPEFTIVRARTLDYSDVEKAAVYSGGAVLTRGDLEVTAREIRAWFRQEAGSGPDGSPGGGAALDRVFAEGSVEILRREPGRLRTGRAETAEYFPAEESVVLAGGSPSVADSRRGVTRGAKILWFAREDRLIVDNSGSGPAVSRIRKRAAEP